MGSSLSRHCFIDISQSGSFIGKVEIKTWMKRNSIKLCRWPCTWSDLMNHQLLNREPKWGSFWDPRKCLQLILGLRLWEFSFLFQLHYRDQLNMILGYNKGLRAHYFIYFLIRVRHLGSVLLECPTRLGLTPNWHDIWTCEISRLLPLPTPHRQGAPCRQEFLYEITVWTPGGAMHAQLFFSSAAGKLGARTLIGSH